MGCGTKNLDIQILHCQMWILPLIKICIYQSANHKSILTHWQISSACIIIVVTVHGSVTSVFVLLLLS